MPTVLALPFVLLALALAPASASAQYGEPPPVQVSAHLLRGPDGEPLRLEPTIEEDQSFEGAMLLTLGLAMTTGALAGFSVMGDQLPTYEAGWRGDAVAGLGASVLFSTVGPLLMGLGGALLSGEDPAVGLGVAAMFEYVAALVLGVAAIAVAPEVGEDWDDPALQANTAMILGIESLGLGLGAILSATLLAATSDPSLADKPMIAPSVSADGASITVRGTF